MSVYDLRSQFPLRDSEFTAPFGAWICRLVEVSDSRPQADRLSWYLAFEPAKGHPAHDQASLRKLELVTTADHLLEHGFPQDLEMRLKSWLAGGEQDGRVEWLDL